jgi:hypothetical protein
VVEELGEANRQLLRLHRLANSLRENADEARRAKEWQLNNSGISAQVFQVSKTKSMS